MHAYEKARADEDPCSGHRPPDMGVLTNANQTVTRMVVHLRELPDRPDEHIERETKREYAGRLLGEVAGLLKRAMILERELREDSWRKSSRVPRIGGYRSGALRAYGRPRG